MIYKVLTGALLALAVTATAQAGEAKKAAKTAAADEVVCTYERSVGSHLGRRVCATRAQREEKSRANQDAMAHLQTGKTGTGKGSGAGPSIR
jgi:hypothetical protein